MLIFQQGRTQAIKAAFPVLLLPFAKLYLKSFCAIDRVEQACQTHFLACSPVQKNFLNGSQVIPKHVSCHTTKFCCTLAIGQLHVCDAKFKAMEYLSCALHPQFQSSRRTPQESDRRRAGQHPCQASLQTIPLQIVKMHQQVKSDSSIQYQSEFV